MNHETTMSIQSADNRVSELIRSALNVELKSTPEDFCVTEALALPPSVFEGSANFKYFRLRKRNFTTFEAVSRIVEYFMVDRRYVTFCGLKDEDAVTDQMISIEQNAALRDVSTFNKSYEGKDNFLMLSPYGYYNEPLTTGGLSGNAFRLRVRNICPEIAREIAKKSGEVVVQFINYYDLQRFGVPTGPKTTHLIGDALLMQDYSKALGVLRKAGTPESPAAIAHKGNSEQFFADLDVRVPAFYMSAASSFSWNKKVNKLFASRLSVSDFHEYSIHDIPFGFCTIGARVGALLDECAALPYHRHGKDGLPHSYLEVARPLVHKVRVKLEKKIDDDRNPGNFSADFSFILPPGTYATNLVTQLFLALSQESQLAL